MKQTIESKYTLELNQQEFAIIIASLFSASRDSLLAYYNHGGSCVLNKANFDTLVKGLGDLQEEFRIHNNIICSSDLIKGLLKE